MGAGDANLGSYVYTAGALPPEPSPQPQNDTWSILLELTEIYMETFYHFSPISLSHPKKFWLLIKIIFKDPFQNNWSRLLANAAFIFVRESIVILTKDCFLSIILHCTQMECLWGGWGLQGPESVSFTGLSVANPDSRCGNIVSLRVERLVYPHTEAWKGLWNSLFLQP